MIVCVIHAELPLEARKKIIKKPGFFTKVPHDLPLSADCTLPPAFRILARSYRIFVTVTKREFNEFLAPSGTPDHSEATGDLAPRISYIVPRALYNR